MNNLYLAYVYWKLYIHGLTDFLEPANIVTHFGESCLNLVQLVEKTKKHYLVMDVSNGFYISVHLENVDQGHPT